MRTTAILSALPPVAVIAAHAVGRVAVDLRLDVGDAEVAQRRGVDLAEQPDGLALRAPVQEADCEPLDGARVMRAGLLRPAGEGRQRQVPTVLRGHIDHGHEWPPSIL